jgi:hypothetical protein
LSCADDATGAGLQLNYAQRQTEHQGNFRSVAFGGLGLRAAQPLFQFRTVTLNPKRAAVLE